MATLTVKGFKGPIEIGSGSIDDGGSDSTISSWSAVDSRVALRRYLTFTVQSGTHAGKSWSTRVLEDDGAGNLTLRDPCPFLTI
jgi:hypothetical protein